MVDGLSNTSTNQQELSILEGVYLGRFNTHYLHTQVLISDKMLLENNPYHPILKACMDLISVCITDVKLASHAGSPIKLLHPDHSV
jgi:hypothetical protein